MGSKFNNNRFKADGYSWDSNREYARYKELCLLERAGDITNLIVKPVIKLMIGSRPILLRSERYPNGRHAKYTPDFSYLCQIRQKLIYEDVKGRRMSDYVLRRGVVEAMLPGTQVDEI